MQLEYFVNQAKEITWMALQQKVTISFGVKVKVKLRCHESQVLGTFGVSNPLHLIVLAANSRDCTTVPKL